MFPLFIVQVVAAFLLSLLILPSKFLYKKKDPTGDLNYYVYKSKTQAPSKLVFMMYGNADCVENYHDGSYSPGQCRPETMLSNYQTKLGGEYAVIGFDPPGVNNDEFVWNESQIIERCTEFVEKKMDEYNVDASNVVCVGHSIGGAFMTQVAANLHRQDKKVYCVADRSFSNLTDVVCSMFHLDIFGMASKFIVSVILWPTFGLLDSASAAKDIKAGYLRSINVSEDDIIKAPASLFRSLKDTDHASLSELRDIVEFDRRIKTSTDPGHAHCVGLFEKVKKSVASFHPESRADEGGGPSHQDRA